MSDLPLQPEYDLCEFSGLAWSKGEQEMARVKRHTPEQIASILKQQEAGLKTAEICRKHGISEQTF